MDSERIKRVMERVYGDAATAKAEKAPPDALREGLRLETAAAVHLRSVMRGSRACANAFGDILHRCDMRRNTLIREYFLREGEKPPLLRVGAPSGVLSALRQLVLLCRTRERLYEAAGENALPLQPETVRRFAAECRAEESAAAKLLALSLHNAL